MEVLLFSPLKLGILLRLLSGVALMQGTMPTSGDSSSPQAYLDTMRPSSELQMLLDETVAELEAMDPLLPSTLYTVAVIDLDAPGGPKYAHVRGDLLMYPASVIKFVYLMATFRWQEEGRLTIDQPMKRQLKSMIYDSSNQATQWVFYRLTGTGPGPELLPSDYAVFRDRRFGVKRWVQAMGVGDVHCVHPTYDSKREIFGREAQFLSDCTIQDGGQGRFGGFYNRLMVSAMGTAKLLALLATDRGMKRESSGAVREMMRRDIRQQPHLARRIAGGASRLPGMEVFAKSGTFGRTYADAGIVRHVSGRQMAVVVYTESQRPGGYRGDFIANVTERMAERVLLDPASLYRPRQQQSVFGNILPAVFQGAGGQ